MTMRILTADEIHILCHALGRDDHGRLRRGQRQEYRNHYDPSPSVQSSIDLLVLAGLMEPYKCVGGWTMYRVTNEGRRQAIKQAMPAPGHSEAQRRYRKWQDTRDAHGMSFGQWLRAGYHWGAAVAAVLAIAGCECRDYVPERGRECRHSKQELRLERTSPLAPPVAVCRCPCETEPQY